MEKILNNSSRICLFCGEEEKEYFQERQKYYECDCEDAIKTRKILVQIDDLKRKLPSPKYKITNQPVISEITK